MDVGLSEKNRPHKVVYEDMNDNDDELSKDMPFCNMRTIKRAAYLCGKKLVYLSESR